MRQHAPACLLYCNEQEWTDAKADRAMFTVVLRQQGKSQWQRAVPDNDDTMLVTMLA